MVLIQRKTTDVSGRLTQRTSQIFDKPGCQQNGQQDGGRQGRPENGAGGRQGGEGFAEGIVGGDDPAGRWQSLEGCQHGDAL